MIKNIRKMNIESRIEEKQFELPKEVKLKIEKFWKKCKIENPNLWDGEVMCVDKFEIKNTQLTISCRKSNYSHYLYDERNILPKKYACSSLVAGSLLETSDNYYIIGELDESTSYPHCMQVSGGSVDNNDIIDGKIDIFNTIIRETEEELNINLQDKKQVEYFELAYVSLPSEYIHTYIILAKGKINMTKVQMQEYYEQYLKKLKANNLEIEFRKIHFIKKDKTTEELKNIKLPKRNYLIDLFKIDSKE